METHSRLTVLLLGSGGREHALAWGIARSRRLDRLVIAPGNPGMARYGDLVTCDPCDAEAVVDVAKGVGADIVVIGPEAPLAAGVANALRKADIPVFGPSREAARLEWDKAFAKDFMRKWEIPTAPSRTFASREIDDAREHVAHGRFPVVIKACGLAAGKGVVVAENPEMASVAVESMLASGTFGEAGSTIVIEEFMDGEEVSVFAVTDGTRYVVLAPSQDHKRAFDGDKGPNTGGMGAYAPASIVDDSTMEFVRQRIIEPTLMGMREAETPFIGCLYVGLMVLRGAEPRVVEYNCRFGDPETQVVIPVYKGDVLDLLFSAAMGALPATGVAPVCGAAACVVVASGGYPGGFQKGKVIHGLSVADTIPNIVVFHAGTARNDNGDIVTSGGRVLGVTAIEQDGDLARAIASAYKATDQVLFDGAFHRTDVGRRALDVPSSS